MSEQTPSALAVLDRVTDTGAIAPMLWPLETLNGLLAAERRRRLAPGRAEVMAAFLRALPIRLDLETAGRAWDNTASIAGTYHLSVYDAPYLELAQRRRLPLATLDRDLRKAKVSAGVDVLR